MFKKFFAKIDEADKKFTKWATKDEQKHIGKIKKEQIQLQKKDILRRIEYIDQEMPDDYRVSDIIRDCANPENGWIDSWPTKDKQIVMAAIDKDLDSFKYADQSLKKDKEFIMALNKRNASPHWFKHADRSIKKNKEVAMVLVKKNGYMINYLDESLQKDKALALEAIKLHWANFKFVHKSFHKNKDFVLSFIKLARRFIGNRSISKYIMEFCSDSIKRDKKIISAISKKIS